MSDRSDRSHSTTCLTREHVQEILRNPNPKGGSPTFIIDSSAPRTVDLTVPRQHNFPHGATFVSVPRYNIEEIDQARRTAMKAGLTLYTWRRRGKNNWADYGVVSRNAHALLLLPQGMALWFNLTDNADKSADAGSNTTSGAGILIGEPEPFIASEAITPYE